MASKPWQGLQLVRHLCSGDQYCYLSHSEEHILCSKKLFLPWILGFDVVDQTERTEILSVYFEWRFNNVSYMTYLPKKSYSVWLGRYIKSPVNLYSLR